MQLTRPPRLRRYIAQTCILAAGLWISSTAWSIDSLPQDPAASKSNSALSRLHDITSQVTSRVTTRASELAMQAFSMLGINYRYGGTSPESGLDCSGLVRYVFKEAWGKDLPRTSAEISRVGEKVEKPDLQPGDLVFYNTLKRGFSHVGIYLGDQKFIHSPSAGGQVRIESMDVAYWKQRFNGARRINDNEGGN
ncbi:C40 family peptidase [Herbaspirillum sp. RTI4]|uniref:C40 family peptidase n=1 Tax=Herbaspirillum sp. RTI4 TaxID=3048640 RepID=UPI002AB479CB|nr:C40 family peptidase [Herbaspirillum sp. RTI4]MDY7579590.1 C40 family peptidase [Herbaspirillum sp. RTI4]MEA9981781.1 C40 family peptidase [Herbaspirillum sp. RTI4]